MTTNQCYTILQKLSKKDWSHCQCHEVPVSRKLKQVLQKWTLLAAWCLPGLNGHGHSPVLQRKGNPKQPKFESEGRIVLQSWQTEVLFQLLILGGFFIAVVLCLFLTICRYLLTCVSFGLYFDAVIFPAPQKHFTGHEDHINAPNPGITQCCNFSVPLILVITFIGKKKYNPHSAAQLISVVVLVLSSWFRFDS